VSGVEVKMGSKNQFDLLGDVESDDLSHLTAAAAKKAAALPKPAAAAPAALAKLPTKPLPPVQAGKVFTVLIKIRLKGWRLSLY
jgi:3-oxoacyl-ACP reductase-like protein